MSTSRQRGAICCAIAAAALYALNAPFSKLLLRDIPPALMAAFLYLGAGTGMLLLAFVRSRTELNAREQPLTRQSLPYAIGMIVLDVAAPFFLMLGLTRTTAANASLLNNFEIVATSVIARVCFKEKIGKRLLLALALITLASALLTFEDASSFTFSIGSLFVLLACVCWGLENNCTRMMSQSDPLQIVVLKGFGSGLGALLLAIAIGESFPSLAHILPVLLLGFVAYGLSIFFYVYAQRSLGAARTSAYYALAPFISTALSFLFFRESPPAAFFIALLFMIAGAYIAARES